MLLDHGLADRSRTGGVRSKAIKLLPVLERLSVDLSQDDKVNFLRLAPYKQEHMRNRAQAQVGPF